MRGCPEHRLLKEFPGCLREVRCFFPITSHSSYFFLTEIFISDTELTGACSRVAPYLNNRLLRAAAEAFNEPGRGVPILRFMILTISFSKMIWQKKLELIYEVIKRVSDAFCSGKFLSLQNLIA